MPPPIMPPRLIRPFPIPMHVGTDICHIPRIMTILRDPSRAAPFVRRILTPSEIPYANRELIKVMGLTPLAALSSTLPDLGPYDLLGGVVPPGPRRQPRPQKPETEPETPTTLTATAGTGEGAGVGTGAEPETAHPEPVQGTEQSPATLHPSVYKAAAHYLAGRYVCLTLCCSVCRDLCCSVCLPACLSVCVSVCRPVPTRRGRASLTNYAYPVSRFAAKEAVIKAHPHLSLRFQSISILTAARLARERGVEAWGSANFIEARTNAPMALLKFYRGNQKAEQTARVSISHDGDYATATCIGFEDDDDPLPETAEAETAQAETVDAETTPATEPTS